MKVKLTLALLATVISAAADTPRLIEALVRVESNGKANAIGDNGKAFGILQIHCEGSQPFGPDALHPCGHDESHQVP
jgi:hypothetical protein